MTERLVFIAAVQAGIVLLLLVAIPVSYAIVVARERAAAGRVEPWTRAMIDTISGEHLGTHLFKLVKRRHRLEFLTVLLQVDRTVIGEYRERLRRLGAAMLPAAERLMRSRDMYERALGIQLYGTFALTEHLDMVVDALRHPSQVVSASAVSVMLRSGNPAYYRMALRHLASFRDWDRRRLTALLRPESSASVEALRRVLADPTYEGVAREAAADALRWHGDPGVAEVAHALLLEPQQSDEDVLAACLRVLAGMGSDRHSDAIRPYLASDSEVLRLHAVSAWASASDDKAVCPPLLEALEDPSPWIVYRAANGIRRRSGSAILERLARDRHPQAAIIQSVIEQEVRS